MKSNSLFNQLHQDLGQVITATKAGDRLPSEPELARKLGVSRATLREAMRTYEIKGLIQRRQGVGTFVRHPFKVIENGLEILESIETLALREGLRVTYGELKIIHRIARFEETESLGLNKKQKVVYISRVILTEGRPIAFLVDILPDDVIDQKELTDGFNGSVLDWLLQRGNPDLANSHCEIKALPASSEIAQALEIQIGDALLCFNSKLYSQEGRVVDFSISYFLPGFFQFHVIRELA